MAISIFKSFISTVTPFIHREWTSMFRLLVDPTTGAPVGIATPNANGPDGIWAPIDVTAAQLNAPSAAMIADLNAVYRLNVAPYTRFTSNGVALVALSGNGVVGPNGLFGNMIAYAPLTISDPGGLTVLGQVRVENFPT